MVTASLKACLENATLFSVAVQLLEVGHVLIGFEVRITFRKGEQFAQGSAEQSLCSGQTDMAPRRRGSWMRL